MDFPVYCIIGWEEIFPNLTKEFSTDIVKYSRDLKPIRLFGPEFGGGFKLPLVDNENKGGVEESQSRKGTMAEITVTPINQTLFRVEVKEKGSTTVHEVTASPSDIKHYGGEVAAERLVKLSFEFLLEREPKESILRSFELPVIERYFYEYPMEIRKRLG